jgi:hypothetical protein
MAQTIKNARVWRQDLTLYGGWRRRCKRGNRLPSLCETAADSRKLRFHLPAQLGPFHAVVNGPSNKVGHPLRGPLQPSNDGDHSGLMHAQAGRLPPHP